MPPAACNIDVEGAQLGLSLDTAEGTTPGRSDKNCVDRWMFIDYRSRGCDLVVPGELADGEHDDPSRECNDTEACTVGESSRSPIEAKGCSDCQDIDEEPGIPVGEPERVDKEEQLHGSADDATCSRQAKHARQERADYRVCSVLLLSSRRAWVMGMNVVGHRSTLRGNKSCTLLPTAVIQAYIPRSFTIHEPRRAVEDIPCGVCVEQLRASSVRSQLGQVVAPTSNRFLATSQGLSGASVRGCRLRRQPEPRRVGSSGADESSADCSLPRGVRARCACRIWRRGRAVFLIAGVL